MQGRPSKLKLVGNAPSPAKRYAGSGYFSGLVVLLFLAGFVLFFAWPSLFDFAPSRANIGAPQTNISVRVIDGDTISLNDGRSNVRLLGLNAPETGERAGCLAERQKGEAAKRRLQELVGQGSVSFQQVACSCAPGTEDTERCNFGRRCGILDANGRDVAATLIKEGLAVRFLCGATSCPPLPRPWC